MIRTRGCTQRNIDEGIAMVDYGSMPGLGPVTYSPEQDVAPERQEAESVLKGIEGVQGVGEGSDSVGDPAWIAYVLDESVAERLPKRVGDRAVVSVSTGRITALPAE
jgi:hypothetical protein